MKRSIAILLLCVSIQYLKAQHPVYSKEVLAKIDQVEHGLGTWFRLENQTSGWSINERMKFHHVRGLTVAVISKYKMEWAKGYGLADSAEKRPVTTETLFQAGSISKSLNSVGVLKLVQDGKLDLYTDINYYLKTWKFPYDSISKGKKITLINLLSHTAGLNVHGFPGYTVGDPIPTLPQVLDGLPPANTPAIRSVFEPGLRFQYSGGGTTISQLIIQDVTGLPYDEYMWKNVLQPLGMLNSSYTQPPSLLKQKQLASAYYGDGKPVKGKYHIYPEQAAAGLWTNPTDLSKYIIETQMSMEERSSKVLKMEWARLRVTPYIDSTAALGVFIPVIGGEKYFNHNGQDEGFTAVYYGSMEGGDGVVVMCNSDDGSILNEVVNSVASVYGWKDFYKPVIKKPVAVSGTILDAYTGLYRFGNDTFSIQKENGTLSLKPKEFPTGWPLVFTSEKDFFINELNGDWAFITGADGKIDGIIWKQPNREQKAERINK